MKCEYCGNHLDYEVTQCPSCGAPCEYVVRPQEQKISVEKSSPGNKELRRMSDVDISFLKKIRLLAKVALPAVAEAYSYSYWSLVLVLQSCYFCE